MIILLNTNSFDIKIPTKEKKIPAYLLSAQKTIEKEKKLKNMFLSEKDKIIIYVSAEKLKKRISNFDSCYDFLQIIYVEELDKYRAKHDIDFIKIYKEYNNININCDITQPVKENYILNSSQLEFKNLMEDLIRRDKNFICQYVAMMGEGKTTMIIYLAVYVDTICSLKDEQRYVIYSCSSIALQMNVANLAYLSGIKFGIITKENDNEKKTYFLDKHFNCGQKKKNERKPTGVSEIIESLPVFSIMSLEFLVELLETEEGKHLLSRSIVYIDEATQNMGSLNIRKMFHSIISNPIPKIILASGTLQCDENINENINEELNENITNVNTKKVNETDDSSENFDISEVWRNKIDNLETSVIRSKTINVPCRMVNRETGVTALLWKDCKNTTELIYILERLENADVFYKRFIDIEVLLHLVKELENYNLKIRDNDLNLMNIELILKNNFLMRHQIIYEVVVEILEQLISKNDDKMIEEFCSKKLIVESYESYCNSNKTAKGLIFDEKKDKFNSKMEPKLQKFLTANNCSSWCDFFTKRDERAKNMNKAITILNRQKNSETEKLQSQSMITNEDSGVILPELQNCKPLYQLDAIKFVNTTENRKLGLYLGDIELDASENTEYSKKAFDSIDKANNLFGKTNCAYGLNTGVSYVDLESVDGFIKTIYKADLKNWNCIAQFSFCNHT
jgi:hypothetical protein